jgi:hypothetical protein
MLSKEEEEKIKMVILDIEERAHHMKNNCCDLHVVAHGAGYIDGKLSIIKEILKIGG